MVGRAGRTGQGERGESVVMVSKASDIQSAHQLLNSEKAPLKSALHLSGKGFSRLLLEVIATNG